MRSRNRICAVVLVLLFLPALLFAQDNSALSRIIKTGELRVGTSGSQPPFAAKSKDGALMGALAGIMEAQYDVLRSHGHSPSEAFNETVEELTQSLIRLVDENGMDWMYSNCSATAQRGALDWKPKFKKAVLPVFKDLYKRVASGAETKRVISSCGKANYQEQLAKELAVIGDSEMWQAGKATRSLRPREAAKKVTKATKGVGGRKEN